MPSLCRRGGTNNTMRACDDPVPMLWRPHTHWLAGTATVPRSCVVSSWSGLTRPPTPLASMLRGGRGGQVRLKTYLFHALARCRTTARRVLSSSSLGDSARPTETATKGARRVNEAIGWLEANDFVTVATRPGHPNTITLLSDIGDGKKYRVPGAVYNKALSKGAEPADLVEHRYIQIPPSFWTSGWMCTLSGAATAMFLVLLTERVGRSDEQELWFSPEVANLRYSLSHDTRSAGLRNCAGPESSPPVAVQSRATSSTSNGFGTSICCISTPSSNLPPCQASPTLNRAGRSSPFGFTGSAHRPRNDAIGPPGTTASHFSVET